MLDRKEHLFIWDIILNDRRCQKYVHDDQIYRASKEETARSAKAGKCHTES